MGKNRPVIWNSVRHIVATADQHGPSMQYIPDIPYVLLNVAEFGIKIIMPVPIVLVSYYFQKKFLFREIVEKEKSRRNNMKIT